MNIFDGHWWQQPSITLVKPFVLKTFRTLNICSMWMSCYVDPQSTLKNLHEVKDTARSQRGPNSKTGALDAFSLTSSLSTLECSNLTEAFSLAAGK